MNPVYASLGTTIFTEMSHLATELGAINLGQGFPEGEGPEDIRRVAADALLTGPNQYPPMTGVPALRDAVAEHYRRFQNLAIEPADVLITSGATEALAAAIFALVTPGDEVLLIQPMYDAYLPLVLRAGGIPRYLTLRPPAWRLEPEEVERAFASSPKLAIFNDPLNPAARVFSAEEVALLADACRRHRTIAICDEVWEHVLFDDHRHHPLIAEPGMEELAVKIGSAGKIFSMTGWKVGFVMASATLLQPITKAHQFLTFTTPPALQTAVAYGLGKDDGYFTGMRADFQRSRDLLVSLLEDAGYRTLQSDGTYFVCVDLAASGVEQTDRDFCFAVVREAGVAVIPVSSFYAEQPVETVIRLCFAKSDAMLREAVARLAGFAR